MSVINEFRPNPSVSTSAFGRVFYGVDNRILFSKILVDDLNVIGRCYQLNDPTSQEISDVLASDGGEVPLQNAGTIIKMVEFQRGIVAFCERGVFYLAGADGGFTAEAYQVSKITEDSLYARNAVVNIGDLIIYVAYDGIIALQANEFGTLKPTNLTETIIDTYYKDFIHPALFSVYNIDKKQIWYVNPETSKALIQDLRTQGFYPQQFSINGTTKKIPTGFAVENADFVSFIYEDIPLSTFNILELKDSNFQDVGVNYESYLVTAEENLGQFTHKKDVPNIMVLMNKTETIIESFDGSDYTYDLPSACYMSAQYDYAQTSAAKTYTNERQIYRVNHRGFIPSTPTFPTPFNDGRSMVEYRDLLRGSGKSVRFKFRSDDNKDMQILGYSVEFTMRGRQ